MPKNLILILISQMIFIHVIGDGNEFLVYDYDDDGKFDYSVGTLGAQIS